MRLCSNYMHKVTIVCTYQNLLHSCEFQLIQYYNDTTWWIFWGIHLKAKISPELLNYTIELEWADITPYLESKSYRKKVYRLVQFSGPFASYLRNMYRKKVYRLVFLFLLFTYLLRPSVSVQGFIGYRRKTCNGRSVTWNHHSTYTRFSAVADTPLSWYRGSK